MAIGKDRGGRLRRSLSRLATASDNTLLGSNHSNVPLLRELVHDDMTFAVYFILPSGFAWPWFYRFSEVLNSLSMRWSLR